MNKNNKVIIVGIFSLLHGAVYGMNPATAKKHNTKNAIPGTHSFIFKSNVPVYQRLTFTNYKFEAPENPTKKIKKDNGQPVPSLQDSLSKDMEKLTSQLTRKAPKKSTSVVDTTLKVNAQEFQPLNKDTKLMMHFEPGDQSTKSSPVYSLDAVPKVHEYDKKWSLL